MITQLIMMGVLLVSYYILFFVLPFMIYCKQFSADFCGNLYKYLLMYLLLRRKRGVKLLCLWRPGKGEM